MARYHIFADEAGCFTFERRPNVSRYFILCTVSMHDCDVGNALVALRRDLAWEAKPLRDYFHASEDKQSIRDAVLYTIMQHKFLIHATIMEKSKAQPQVRSSRARFYQYSWYYQFKHGVIPSIFPGSDVLITAASLGNKKERNSFINGIKDVMNQTIRGGKWHTDFCPANADPCLQVADYCAWAIQRKWEGKDERSYDIIKKKLVYEYELFKSGDKHYY